MEGSRLPTSVIEAMDEHLPRVTTAAIKDQILDDYFTSKPNHNANVITTYAHVKDHGTLSDDERSEGSGGSGSTRRRLPVPPKVNKTKEDSSQLGQKISKMHFNDDIIRRSVYKGSMNQHITGAADFDDISEAGFSISSDAEIAQRTSDKQLQIIQQSPAMEKILKKVLEVHNNVVEVLTELVYRKDLSAKVDAANKTYIKLFEKMLAEVLNIQRQKFNTQTKSVEQLEAKVTELNLKIVDVSGNFAFMNAKALGLADINKELGSTIRTRDMEIRMLQDQVNELESIKADYLQSLADAKAAKENYKIQRQELERKLRAEDRINRMRELADMRQQWLRESSLAKEHEQNQAEKMIANEEKASAERHAETMKDMIARSTDHFKRPKKTASTQTGVDDDGFWDVSKGWTLPVTGTIEARNRWRRAYKFATCKSCKGVGGYVAKAVALYYNLVTQVGHSLRSQNAAEQESGMDDEDEEYELKIVDDRRQSKIPLLENRRQSSQPMPRTSFSGEAGQIRNKDKDSKSKKDKKDEPKQVFHNIMIDAKYDPSRYPNWMLPDAFLLFMSNLPVTVKALSPRSRTWTIRRVWQLVESKIMADRMDSNLSKGIQDNAEFLIEDHLLHAPKRSQAEKKLYELIIAIKDNYQKHPLLHTYCRILSLVRGQTSEEIRAKEELIAKAKAITLTPPPTKALPPTRGGPSGSSSSASKVGLVISAALNPEPSTPRVKFSFSVCEISLPIATVYFYARSCLLRAPYAGIFYLAMKHVYSSCKPLKENRKRLFEEPAVAGGAYGRQASPPRNQGGRQTAATIAAAAAAAAADKLAEGVDGTLSIVIPDHIWLDKNQMFWIPVDRALRVMQAIFKSAKLDNSQQQKLYSQFENRSTIVTKSGTFVQVVTTQVKQQIRNLCQQLLKFRSRPFDAIGGNEDPYSDGRDLSFESFYEESTPASPGVDEAERLFNDEVVATQVAMAMIYRGAMGIVLVNLDTVLQLIVEGLLLRVVSEEQRLQSVYRDGDEDGDGVLSFQEFKTIFEIVEPSWHERKVMNVFREALMSSKGNNDSIGPEAFAGVCARHGLLKLADVPALKAGPLKALSYSDFSRPTTPRDDHYDSDFEDSGSDASDSLSLKEKKRRAKLLYSGDDHREVRPEFDGRKQYLPPDSSQKKKEKKGKKGLLAEQDSLVDEKFDPTGTPNGQLTPIQSRLGSAQSSNSALQSSKNKSSQKSSQSLSRPSSKQNVLGSPRKPITPRKPQTTAVVDTGGISTPIEVQQLKSMDFTNAENESVAMAIASAVAAIGFHHHVEPEESRSQRERKHTINMNIHRNSVRAMRQSLSLEYQRLAMEDESGKNKLSSLTTVGGKDEFVVLEVGTVAPPGTPNTEEEQDEIDWLDEDADDCGIVRREYYKKRKPGQGKMSLSERQMLKARSSSKRRKRVIRNCFNTDNVAEYREDLIFRPKTPPKKRVDGEDLDKFTLVGERTELVKDEDTREYFLMKVEERVNKQFEKHRMARPIEEVIADEGEALFDGAPKSLKSGKVPDVGGGSSKSHRGSSIAIRTPTMHTTDGSPPLRSKRRQGVSINMGTHDPDVIARKAQQNSTDIVSELKLRKARRLEKKLNDRRSLTNSVIDKPSTPTADLLADDPEDSEKMINDEY